EELDKNGFIDWIKIEEEPSKRYKIQGQFLLDLQAKSEILKEKLEELDEKIIDMKNENQSIAEELEQTQETNKKGLEEKEELIRELELQTENLKIKFENSNRTNNNLSDLLKKKEAAILEVSTTSDQKISRKDSELENAYNKISALESTLNNIKNESASKDEEIGKFTLLIKELEEVKDKLNLELIEKTEMLAEKNSIIKELNEDLDEKNNEIESQTKQLQECKDKLEEFKPPDITSGTFSYDNRIICPNCGAVGKHIEKVDDKKKVLSYIGSIPMYAKKYVCKNCTYEWI
ncbi:MAG: coiled-coil domain-containing protein, partial [Promethearchaeota archaeon]